MRTAWVSRIVDPERCVTATLLGLPPPRSRVKHTCGAPEGFSKRYSAVFGTSVRASTFSRRAAAYCASTLACDAAGGGAAASAGNITGASGSGAASAVMVTGAATGAGVGRRAAAACGTGFGGSTWGAGGAGTSSSREIRTPGSCICTTGEGAGPRACRAKSAAAVKASAMLWVTNSGVVRFTGLFRLRDDGGGRHIGALHRIENIDELLQHGMLVARDDHRDLRLRLQCAQLVGQLL